MENKNKKNIRENSFEGSPAGYAGAVSYAPNISTFSSPVVSQNSNAFDSNNLNKNPPTSDGSTDLINTSGSFDKDIDNLFDKNVNKSTPSPDVIMSALQYELGRMIRKDKALAKNIVIKNLKFNIKYYNDLNMLNANDDIMKVNENEMKLQETKKILDKMIMERNKSTTKPSQAITDIINQKIDERDKKRYGH